MSDIRKVNWLGVRSFEICHKSIHTAAILYDNGFKSTTRRKLPRQKLVDLENINAGLSQKYGTITIIDSGFDPGV